MKTTGFMRLGGRIWAVSIFLFAVVFGRAAESENSARIKLVRIERTNVVVEVEVSGDFRKVTLESSRRLGRRAWEPRAVKLLADGEGPNMTFTVPISPAIEVLRVKADLADNSLPASFYSGTNDFTLANQSPAVFDGSTGGAAGAPSRDNSNSPEAGDPSRSVVESDIWKVEGDTMFFFNQYRGLQVINVSNPASPVVTGTYDLPGSGEQMYVINGTNVVLLARDNCSWYGNGNDSRAVLLQLREGVPHLVKELPIRGYIAESRLVGTALYVVANSYQSRLVERNPSVTSEVWEWGSEVVSFDLADFATATHKSQDWVRGYGNVIMATDRYLFVAQAEYERQSPPYSSLIHCFDISSPNGTFTKLSTFNAGGIVKDKFKMHVAGETFVAVVQIENWNSMPRLVTQVNTFSLSDPRNPALIGRLKIIENEQLFATRFHGNLLYAVTFFVIDPLWVIDLSNPAAPKKVGELEIPGWSTYLQPLGDKLLAIGLDQTNGSRRTAVQLFDVSDPTKPTQLSKVLIGDQWSHSEANWDEKAFGVLPGEKLILVPFHSSGAQGYTEGVQLIDLEATNLLKRGIVEHNMGARRATVHRGTLLSLSSRELLSVDASNRDKPVVVNSLQLSWAADRVHVFGDYVVEVDATGSTGPTLRVVDAANTTSLRSFSQLTNYPYMGSMALGSKLYVLQGRGTEYTYPPFVDAESYKPISTNPAVFFLSEFDLSALPELRPVSMTRKEGSGDYFYGQYQPIEVKPGVIVWANKSYGGWWWRGGPILDGPMMAASSRMAVDIAAPGLWWPGGGGASGHFIATDVSGPTPVFASELTLSGTNGWWNFSDSFAANGLLYTSHQASEYDPQFDPPPYETVCWTGTNYVTCTNDPPPGSWVTRYYLDVIDFSDPRDPLVRKPVNVPGSLIGLHRNGEILYTRGSDFHRFYYYSSDEVLSASSYDGVNAHLVASLVLNQNWPRPAISDGGFIYIGSPATTNNTNATIQTWTLSNAGKFEQVSSETVSTPAQQLEKVNDLIVAQTDKIQLYDARNPADLTLVGSGQAASCYGVLLDAADGNATRGLWLPVGWYGVIHIPVRQ